MEDGQIDGHRDVWMDVRMERWMDG